VFRPILFRLLALLLALHLPLSGMAAPVLLSWADGALHSGHASHDHSSQSGHDHASHSGHDHANHTAHGPVPSAAHQHPDAAADAVTLALAAPNDAAEHASVSPDNDDRTHHHDHCAFCHIAGSVIAPALAAAPAQRGAHVLVASRPQLRVADAPEAPFRPPSVSAL
jgi:hypothetical protein